MNFKELQLLVVGKEKEPARGAEKDRRKAGRGWCPEAERVFREYGVVNTVDFYREVKRDEN